MKTKEEIDTFFDEMFIKRLNARMDAKEISINDYLGAVLQVEIYREVAYQNNGIEIK